MKIAVTGHRPNKLPGGYDIHSFFSKNLIEVFKCMLKSLKATEAISGMALGVDTLFAIAALQLQKEGYNIKLVCAVPCLNQDKLWTEESKKLYRAIINNVKNYNVEVVYVTNTEYNNSCMQKRNEYMVDRCDILIAVWDGSNSGTANCVKYAASKHKKMYRLDPKEVK